MDYDELLDRLRPSEEEMRHVRQATDRFIQSLQNGMDFEVMPGGSTAKGTNLANNFDVDIFVRFRTAGKLSNMLEQLLSHAAEQLGFTPTRIRGSRDYFTFEFEELFFEVVPVKYVEGPEDAENVTDMSPLHVLWAKEHLTAELADDIRLAKQFCRAAGIYGAESYINGISGHVIDLLVIHYGGFEQMLQEVSKWSGITVLDPEGQHKDVFSDLNQAKLRSPLILIDPVDPTRNAAAALSEENYRLFIETAQAFLKSPDESFFEVTSLSDEELEAGLQDDEELFIINVVPLEGKRDIAFTKIRKVYEFLERHLRLEEFPLRRSGWEPREKDAKLYFYLKAEPLADTYVREVPPSVQQKDVERFCQAHPDAYEQNGRWYVRLEREYTQARDYLSKLLSEAYVCERVASVSMD